MPQIEVLPLSITLALAYIINIARSVNVAQQFQADGSGQRMPDVISTVFNMSLVSCGLQCTRTPSCLSFNYHDQTRACQLSSNSGHDSNVTIINGTGWTVYRSKLPYDCPNSVMGFVPVGTMRVKLCRTLVDQQTANASCSPFGRLAKIDTADKISAVQQYLFSLNSQEDVWVNGYRHNLTTDDFIFDDGAPVASRDDHVFWNPTGNPDGLCLRLIPPSFALDDKQCDRLFHFMCELY